MYKIKKSRVCCYKSEKTVRGKYNFLVCLHSCLQIDETEKGKPELFKTNSLVLLR